MVEETLETRDATLRSTGTNDAGGKLMRLELPGWLDGWTPRRYVQAFSRATTFDGFRTTLTEYGGIQF